ncbi:hypothetical protein PG997_013037 [Apiospora hydei]|uniref:Uncharacterized protein n=1 Tax=Apiospora hydei TaxID=1337664 RepID=A0ABR1V7P8_9PEZI
MKFITGTLVALAAAGAMASPVSAVLEGLLSSSSSTIFLPGEPTTVHFSLLNHTITCDSEALAEWPSERFYCTDPGYTFLVLDSPTIGSSRSSIC